MNNHSPSLRPPLSELQFALSILLNPYIPHTPTARQKIALETTARELFYGGAAGGGKSNFLLMAALQYVMEPGYSAIIIRKSYTDLSRPGALIPRSHEWLEQTDAVWNEQQKQWHFPSGAVLAFGYMETENDKYRYQGGEYHYIGADEITHLSLSQYLYMFSRLRKLSDNLIPARMRCTGNPDGIGFEWVKHRFVDPGHPSRPYIHSRLTDNPYLDIADYEQSLNLLDPITQRKLRDGDWSARMDGKFFVTDKIEIIDDFEETLTNNIIRRWDLASTPEPGAGDSNDPDYTVGAKLCVLDGYLYILDIVRGRWEASGVEHQMEQTAKRDGRHVRIIMEEEGGSSGKLVTNYLRTRLQGYAFEGKRSTGSKEVRARPLAGWMNAGKVRMIRAAWNNALIDEMILFPHGNHDDQVDAIASGFIDLSPMGNDSVYATEGIGAASEIGIIF